MKAHSIYAGDEQTVVGNYILYPTYMRILLADGKSVRAEQGPKNQRFLLEMLHIRVSAGIGRGDKDFEVINPHHNSDPCTPNLTACNLKSDTDIGTHPPCCHLTEKHVAKVTPYISECTRCE